MVNCKPIAVTAITLTIILFLLLSCKQNKANQAVDKEGDSIFPKGIKAPESYFTGRVSVHQVNADDSVFHCVMGSVTFEAGARSNWHTHPAGQILIITAGECYTQERGKSIQVYHKGDIVKCLPNVEHWHGASPNGSMTHIAVNPNAGKGVVNWLGPVSDQEYQAGNGK